MILTTLIAMATVASSPTYSVDRIAFDSRSLIIDGKPTFVYSGAFHYFRCPKELWRDRFRAIKAAGLNAVETYVPWNWHERERPKSVGDYSKMDLTDFRDWLKMAHEEFRLYTIVRPGPYICAEWAGGGYPRWFVALRPVDAAYGKWLRGDDETYLKWSKHWYDAVCKVIAPEQVSRKKAGQKGVILFQIENEYDFWGGATSDQRKNQLKALYEDARKDGIDVPIIGCWTREIRHKAIPGMVGVFDSPNLYSRHDIDGAGAQIDSVKRDQTDAPGMVTELQGGWFSGIGGQLSEDQGNIGADQIRAITLECMARGATILNYYMFFGGTHFGDWGSRGMTTTYDYFAPIREWGATGAKYAEVQAVGRMLSKYGEAIAQSERVDREVQNAKPGVRIIVRRGPAGEHFVFLRNSSENEERSGIAKATLADGAVLSVSYILPAFGTDVVVMDPGVTNSWEGRRICVASTATDRPQTPGAIRVASVRTREEAMPSKWSRRKSGEPLVDSFPTDTALTMYRSVERLTAAQIAKIDALTVALYANDACLLKVNGRLAEQESQTGGRVSFPVKSLLKEGENEFLLLYEDKGHSNWGAGMEDLNGIDRAYLTDVAAALPVTEWRVKVMRSSDSESAAGSEYDDSNWDRLVLDSETVAALEGLGQPGALGPKWPAATILFGKRDGAMYRTRIDVSQQQIDSGLTTLVFDRIDDRGTIYVNGQVVGRHSQWDVPCEIDVKKYLKPGSNTIAVYVVNNENEGGLTRAVRLARGVAEGVPVAFGQVARLRGTSDGWAKLDASETGWDRVQLDTSSPIDRKGGSMPKAEPSALAVWTRAQFELPATVEGVWVPWRALIRASGNGEMFLNGHSIGRYWEAGPQREFFLPECWLNFGKGKKNVLTFCLRSTENGAKVDALEISPYPDSAEYRN